MRRALARFVFVTVLGTLAMVLGIVTSLTLTPPGRDLLARGVSVGLDRVVTGHVDVGAISGSFLYDLNLERLVVRDTQGVLLADLPRVHVSYRIPNFLAGRIVLNAVHADEPVINLVKHPSGRMNYEEVLNLGTGKPGGGPSPLVLFSDVQIHGGTLRIALPYHPPAHATTAGQRDSALAAERAKPGRQIVPSREGLQRVIRFEQITAFLPTLQIATPDRKPFTIDIDTLATRVSDPAVTLRDAVGRVRFHGDSVVFSLSRAALPNTLVRGGGAVTWPRDTVLFDFMLTAPRVDLQDLLWISPLFPRMTGRGLLAARSVRGARTEYTLRALHLEDRPRTQRIDGDLVAVTDQVQGLGVRGMNLRLANVDLDVARAYLDTLPFYGTLSGTVSGSGWLLGPLDLKLDWSFADAKVPGRPVSTLAGDGRIVVSTNPDSGLTFGGFELRRSNVDLGTVRRIAPAVLLPGRLQAVGTLTGPLRDVTFEGRAVQRDGDRPASAAAGRLHLDTRDSILALNADMDLDPLSFDGIRRAFPTLAARGELRGHVKLDGSLARADLDATLAGAIGDVTAQGVVTLLPPRWGAEDLHLGFRRLDLAALRGTGPTTSLDGTLLVTGSIDTLRAPEGQLALALGRSRVREWTLDTVYARAAMADSVIRLDTLFAGWLGATASGAGTLGWSAPHAGTMRFGFHADSLVGFDSLAVALGNIPRDTSILARPLNGVADGRLVLDGNLDSMVATGDVAVRGFEFQRWRSPELRADVAWTGGARPVVAAEARADTLRLADRTGGRSFGGLRVAVAGHPDSLGWGAGGTVGLVTGRPSRLDAAGSWHRIDGTQVVTVDTLAARLVTRRWRLLQPVAVTLSDSAPSFTPVALEATDGSGLVRASGRWPGAAPGAVSLDALGLDLRDVYALVEADTLGIAGKIGLDLDIGGTAREPVVRGDVRLADASIGEARFPYLQTLVDYGARRLDATLQLWRTGQAVFDVTARLPIDLGMRGVERRLLPGPISVHAHADSMELAILEALTPAARRVSGTVDADVEVGGTFDAPEVRGTLGLRQGAMSLPDLGIRLTGIGGRVDMSGDSLLVRDVTMASDGGSLAIGGAILLDSLTKPVLALDLRSDRFHAINVRNFLDVTVTGDLHLRGPVFRATLTGRADADRGVLYFADLVTKNVIDLQDPTNADLVDTTVIRARGLGGGFQNRFLDSLRVQDLLFGVGSDFWLRSGEANIQLSGRDVLVNKERRQYRIDGTLTALRGSYTLKIGPVSRDFAVEKGSVTYEGTPDLNARIDISARHTVRAADRREIPVIANISGTLQQPKLVLTSGPNVQPPIPEVDLISYLILGVPSGQASGAQVASFESAASYFASAVSSELERAVVSDIGLPIDLFELRPGFSAGNTTIGAGFTELAAGKQIGPNLFFTVTAGLCGADFRINGNLGASLELRFSQHWSAQIGLEPTLTKCGVRGLGSQFLPTNPYQIGADLNWEREFGR